MAAKAEMVKPFCPAQRGPGEELVMAWWLRGHTTRSRPWIAQRLHLGHATRVTLAVREVSRSKDGPLAKLKRRLQEVRQPDDS